jgi:hypothetical protein
MDSDLLDYFNKIIENVPSDKNSFDISFPNANELYNSLKSTLYDNIFCVIPIIIEYALYYKLFNISLSHNIKNNNLSDIRTTIEFYGKPEIKCKLLCYRFDNHLRHIVLYLKIFGLVYRKNQHPCHCYMELTKCKFLTGCSKKSQIKEFNICNSINLDDLAIISDKKKIFLSTKNDSDYILKKGEESILIHQKLCDLIFRLNGISIKTIQFPLITIDHSVLESLT